jgi:hypothetical protein
MSSLADRRISLETAGLKHDLTGRKFGRLLVISLAEKNGVKTKWVCSCACGKIVDTPTTQRLLDGRARSCARKGCARTHGKADTLLYRRWHLMKRRCYRPQLPVYKWYGAKGIKVCKAWHSFENFYNWAMANGFQPHLTIDRIDAKKDYEPANCQWITQAKNSAKRVIKRKTRCIHGHPLTKENSYWFKTKDGYMGRGCNVCRRIQSRRGYLRRRKRR